MEDDDKDLELKDLILQTLEANGLLSKMKVKQFNKQIILKKLITIFKAQIQANIFLALEENENNQNLVCLINKKI